MSNKLISNCLLPVFLFWYSLDHLCHDAPPNAPNKSNSIHIQLTFISIHLILTCLLSYFALKATYINPTDSLVLKERRLMKWGLPIPVHEDTSKIVFCYICQAHADLNSKHCSKCDRCVERFDHHCVWLNNCIGKKNYKLFFKAILVCTF